jgi:proteasome accessory factor C
MDKLSRLAALRRIFRDRRPVSRETLAAELECSIPTAKRAIREARETLGMPIVWDADARGYVLDRASPDAGEEVPGLWLTAPELAGLVTLHSCLQMLTPEPIGPLLAPLGRRLDAVLQRSGVQFDQVRRRVRILGQPGRPPGRDWATLTEALLTRTRTEFEYRARSRPETTLRTVSPQRLVLYRGSWYLDAWCHLRDDLRSFSVERIGAPRLVCRRATDVSEAVLDQRLATSYGIFSGAPTDVARLRFSSFATRWVGEEIWHPRQSTVIHGDGTLEIAFPIGRREELILDVLRWGPEVEVLAPRDLRTEVAARLAAAAALYDESPSGNSGV